MDKFLKTSDARRGGEFQGESHQGVNNGMRAVIVDNGNEPILVEGSEAIINKKAMNSTKKYTITGTTRQIVSTLNQKEGNGRAIGDSEAEILKIFNEGGTISSQKDVIYNEWKKLVNMSASEITIFYNSEEGKVAGLSNEESDKLGISNGRESSRWIVKMKRTPYSKWTNEMFVWAKKQISFIKRMSGNRGGLYDEDGEKTRKHTSLLIWGHNPEKNKVEFEKGGDDIRFAKGGTILNNSKDIQKFSKIGISDKYVIEAINEIGLQNTKFDLRSVDATILEEFTNLLSEVDKYVISEDSEGITRAIETEIEARFKQGDSDDNIMAYKLILDNPQKRKELYIDKYAETQRETLGEWLSYLKLSEYSISLKYLLLKAVLNFNYDYKKNTLIKRTNKTIRNFTPFDAGALGELIQSNSNSLLQDYTQIQISNSKNILDKKELVKTSSGGTWLKFDGGAKTSKENILENSKELSQLVQNTYWCTKTNSKSQLDGGDFYVYVTENNGEVFPRIAIRMNEDKVGEVRGNNSSSQDLEIEMIPVAKQFLLNNIGNDSGGKWLDSIEYNEKAILLYDKLNESGLFKNSVEEFIELRRKENQYLLDYADRNGHVLRIENFINEEVQELPNKFYKKGEVIFDLVDFDVKLTKIIIGDFIDDELTDLGTLTAIGGDANFGNSKLTDLGNLTKIGGYADFENSLVTDLGNLTTIGGYANFENSKLTDLGNLTKIGGDANFENSKLTDLGNLTKIGGDAFFENSKLTGLGSIMTIGGDAFFKNSLVTDLENLTAIGGYANFERSLVTDLGNLTTIGGNARFGSSLVTDLGNLTTIGGDADFGRSLVTDLGNLTTIGGYANFENSKLTDLGNLTTIGGNAEFGRSKLTDLGNLTAIGGYARFGISLVTDLGNLTAIGGYADFGSSLVTDLGNLTTIGGDTDFGSNYDLERKWESIEAKRNNDIRFEDGGFIGSELVIVKYRITLMEGDWETFYGGLNDDKDDAYFDYNRINNSDFDDSNAKTNQKMLEKLTYKYNFIGELDSEYDETIEDFKEDYENDDLWELVDEPEIEYLESEDVVAVNDDTDSMINEIQEFINEKYIHKQYGKKYMVLDVENEDEDSIGSFTIRVADHSGNPQNKKGKTLSFVIANENGTAKRFNSRDEYSFNSNDDLEEIKSEVSIHIEEAIEEIKNSFEDGGLIKSGSINEMIKSGIIKLNFYDTTTEHAKGFGIDAKKPLYIQELFVSENFRLKGIGKQVLNYLNDYAVDNGNDVIFGYVANKSKFTKDSNQTFFSDLNMIRCWFHNNGYAVNDDNNDFHKVITTKASNKEMKLYKIGGSVDSENQDYETQDLLSGEAEKRRKAEMFKQDDIVYNRNKKNEGIKGNTGEVRFSSDVSVLFTYKLIESSELQPSHQNGIRNKYHFIPEAQPKSRNDDGSIQAEDNFANAPRFNELGENSNAYSGAPIVNERDEVVQGNNRASGLKKGYLKENFKYKEDLIVNATKFGFTEKQVLSLRSPILVRELKINDMMSIDLGNYDVKDLETGGKRRLDPVAVTRRMPFYEKGKIVNLLFKNNEEEGQTLNQAIRGNQDKLITLISPFINQAQKNTIVKDGQLTEGGIKDLELVIQYFMFDNADVSLPEIFESLSHLQKEGLRKSLPYLFGVKDYKKSILPEVQDAIYALNDFETNDGESFNAWRKQTDIFNDNKTPEDVYSATDLAIAELMLNAKSQKEIIGLPDKNKNTSSFAKYTTLVNGSPSDMFNEEIVGVSKKEAVKETFKTDLDNEVEKNPKEVESSIAKQSDIKELIETLSMLPETDDLRELIETLSMLVDAEDKTPEKFNFGGGINFKPITTPL